MNRRSFLKWLGIGVSTTTVAAVVVPALGTSEPETVSARLGEWNNYCFEGDPESMAAIENWKSHPYHHTATLPYYDEWHVESLKVDATSFAALAERRSIPVNAGVKREFFTYNVKS
jgi:hypothetical protein